MVLRTSRRGLLTAAGAGAAAMVAGRGRAEPVLGDDGLYHEPWFLQSFLELSDDLTAAAAAGKRFAILWELRGCPYCRETHLVNFARADIADFIRTNFDILQLDIIGSRKVTDFDGTVLSEKQLAGRYGIRFTPTVQFFPESTAGLAARPPTEREVSRAPGYLLPDDFLGLFRFVRERAYESKSFLEFLRAARS
jgi:thioredoxin-related protein